MTDGDAVQSSIGTTRAFGLIMTILSLVVFALYHHGTVGFEGAVITLLLFIILTATAI